MAWRISRSWKGSKNILSEKTNQSKTGRTFVRPDASKMLPDFVIFLQGSKIVTDL
jgi:hypothetical protein